MNKGRLESFSDGVISVSLTLMLYQIQLPAEFTWVGLWKEAHNFFGYVLSFIYVGIYWNNHHHLFLVVRGINGRIMWANLNLLFWLTMIPLTTTWAGKSGLLALPTALYAAVLFMCALSYWGLERVIIVSEGKDSVLANTLGKDLKGKISLPVYALAIVVSFYSTMAAFSIFTAMAVLWFLPDSRIERYLARQDGQQP
ncbi:TMEM175 family protein [Comamonas sp. 4034]|uniref:TMEM175 family protein n=1 Tax=Comamonas sp. 4034 TaxID=3156455 RepID=UPI003D25A236